MRTNLGVALVTLLCSAAALAGEPGTVMVTAEVVLVSKKDDVVDPPKLAAMKAEFQKSEQSKQYTSFRRVSEKKLELRPGKIEVVPLDKGRQATVRLEELKEDTARVFVQVPNLVSTTLTLGKKGALYQHAGAVEGDAVLFLVLSPGQ